DARGDVLSLVRHMLADIALGISELVGKHERFPVFGQRLAPILVKGVNWHGEEAKLHGAFPRGCCTANVVVVGLKKNDYSYYLASGNVMVHAHPAPDQVIRRGLRGDVVYGRRGA